MKTRERWADGDTHTNHWKSATHMINVENPNLKGGGLVNCATPHESIVLGTMAQQEKIIPDATRQEESIAEAAKEREQIVEILTRQAMEIERTREDR